MSQIRARLKMFRARACTAIPRVLIKAIIALSLLAAQAASAQSTSLLSAVQRPPTYCKGSKLNSAEFIQMIHAIIAQGDLTDITFIEKTLRTTFIANHTMNGDGTPNTFYNTDEIDNSPIHVRVDVWSDAVPQMGKADLIIYDTNFPNAKNNFIGDCLHILPVDFYSSLALSFNSVPASPPVGLIDPPGWRPSIKPKQNSAEQDHVDYIVQLIGFQTQTSPGKNGTNLTTQVDFPAKFRPSDNFPVHIRDYPPTSMVISQQANSTHKTN